MRLFERLKERARARWGGSGEEPAWLANRAPRPLAVVIGARGRSRRREQHMPIRGLTLERATSLLEAGERGEYADLQWLYRFVERRDATLCALLSRYDGGLLKLDWEIKLAAGSGAEAQAQARVLREAYGGVDNLREALQFLVGARFRGFAHLEKWFGADGQVTHLEPVPQWHWVRDGLHGAWQYNREARSGASTGEPIDPAHFVVREVDRPVDELAVLIHVRRNECQEGWDVFVRTYGVPSMFMVGPPGATAELEAGLAAQIEGATSDSRGYLPYGTQLTSVPVTARGVNPFRTYLKALDEQLVLAATGGKLSVLSEPGVGQQAGFVHWRVWREIVQAEALLISETFQQQFDAPLLAARFPGRPLLAYFELCGKEETDVGSLVEQTATLSRAGYRVDPAQLSEKTGYRFESGAGGSARGPVAGDDSPGSNDRSGNERS